MSKLVKYYGVSAKKGEYIFREGDPADSMYMIHKGRVQISKGIGALDENLRIFGEGEFFGEMAVINSLPRSANAIALEDCVFIKMNRESFDETVKKNHEFALSVIQLLSIRLRETDELLMVHAKKFRVSELYAELLSDMLSFGKKDSTGSLGLIKKEPFLERATERLNWDMKGVQSILNDLCVTTKVKMKKDSQGAEWIAVQLKNHEDPAI